MAPARHASGRRAASGRWVNDGKAGRHCARACRRARSQAAAPAGLPCTPGEPAGELTRLRGRLGTRGAVACWSWCRSSICTFATLCCSAWGAGSLFHAAAALPHSSSTSKFGCRSLCLLNSPLPAGPKSPPACPWACSPPREQQGAMASSGSQPPAAPAAPGGPAGSQPGVITISRVQRQADELETAMAALGRRVAGAEAETLRQLQLLDAAAQGLEVRQ